MRAGYSRISSESGGDEESNDDGADLEPLAFCLKDSFAACMVVGVRYAVYKNGQARLG